MKSGGPDQAPTPVVLAHSPAFRLGPVEVRPATREVIGPGGREVIEPRIMQVLVALHDAGGEIVSRDDLIACCWDGRVVGDDAINRVISKLRRVGETVGGSAFRIETITKVGYRLVLENGVADNVPAVAPTTPAKPQRPGVSRRALIGGAAAAAALGGGGIWYWQRGSAPSRIPPELQAEFDAARNAMLTGAFDQSIAGFQRLADRRPDVADFWGSIAVALELSGRSQRPEAAEMTASRIRQAIERALEIDPENSTALTAQGMGQRFYGEWLAPETIMHEVLERDPEQVIARDFLSRVYENVGRTRDALALLEPYAQPFDDIPSVQYRMAIQLWAAGRDAEANQLIDRALGRWPDLYVIWFSRYWLYVRMGRPQLALAMAQRVRPPTDIPRSNFDLNDLHARAVLTRAPADIRRAVAANREFAPRGAGYCENAINFAAQMELLDEAYALAEAYYFGRGFRVAATRFSQVQGSFTPSYRRLTFFLFTPIFEAFRADPRWRPLTEETGLASYWRRSGTRPDVMA